MVLFPNTEVGATSNRMARLSRHSTCTVIWCFGSGANRKKYHNAQDGFDRTQLAPLTPDDRARLVKFGTKEGSSIKALITIVTPRTFAQ